MKTNEMRECLIKEQLKSHILDKTILSSLLHVVSFVLMMLC